MKKQLLPIFSLLSFVLLIWACEKEYEPGEGTPVNTNDTINIPTGGGNGGGGQDTTGNGGGNNGGGQDTTGTGGGNNGGGQDTTGSGGSGTLTACNYYPYVSGKEATFRGSDGNTFVSSFSSEETVGGFVWVKATLSNDPSNVAYYRCDGTYGYIRQQIDGSTVITLRPVKVNGQVNDSWTDELVINGVPSRYEHTILSTTENRTIEGNDYTNVMEVELVYSYDVSGNGDYFPFGFYVEYFDVNAGLIESTLNNTTLVSHNF